MTIEGSSRSGNPPAQRVAVDPAGAPPGQFEVYEAEREPGGAWRLDEAALRGPTWLDRVKQALLVGVALATVAVLWVFALALAILLAPVVAIAVWWMWRRLSAGLRARQSRPGTPV